jgi:hypothetical protein
MKKKKKPNNSHNKMRESSGQHMIDLLMAQRWESKVCNAIRIETESVLLCPFASDELKEKLKGASDDIIELFMETEA